MKNFKLTLFLFAILPAPAFADCVDVIRAAAIRGTVVQGASSIDREAKNFCSEYATAKQSGKSLSVSGSYAGIGLGVGSSSSKVEQVASKYCDANDSYKSRDSSYEQYVEEIAPGAFSAYAECAKVTGDWIEASLNPIAIHATDLMITVGNKTSGQNYEDVQFLSSPGIVCAWSDPNAKKNSLRLAPNGGSAIQCKRKSESAEGSILINTRSRPNANYNFLWKKYQKGLPVDELQAIKIANLALVESLTTAVVAFDSECPSGWIVAPAMAGRVIVGAGAATGLTERARGDSGGEETHLLTIAEMPSHTHSYIFTKDSGTPTKVDTTPWEHGDRKPDEQTGAAGGSQPHNNMPPYQVLQFCRRS